jgi:transcription termination/antitermination protein NusG
MSGEKKWYSLRVISGKEKKIKEKIDLEIQRSGWQHIVTNVVVPTEKVFKIKSGKRVPMERNLLPGYIIVEADPEYFTSEVVQSIASITNVINFLGGNQPVPMKSHEANRLLGKADESDSMGEVMLEPFIVGEAVKIIEGPFNGFIGEIFEIIEDKNRLKVTVKIFGRGTEVELGFMQVEKQH